MINNLDKVDSSKNRQNTDTNNIFPNSDIFQIPSNIKQQKQESKNSQPFKIDNDIHIKTHKQNEHSISSTITQQNPDMYKLSLFNQANQVSTQQLLNQYQNEFTGDFKRLSVALHEQLQEHPSIVKNISVRDIQQLQQQQLFHLNSSKTDSQKQPHNPPNLQNRRDISHMSFGFALNNNNNSNSQNSVGRTNTAFFDPNSLLNIQNNNNNNDVDYMLSSTLTNQENHTLSDERQKEQQLLQVGIQKSNQMQQNQIFKSKNKGNKRIKSKGGDQQSMVLETASFLEVEATCQSDADLNVTQKYQEIKTPNMTNMNDKMNMEKRMNSPHQQLKHNNTIFQNNLDSLQLPKFRGTSNDTMNANNINNNLNVNGKNSLSAVTPQFRVDSLQPKQTINANNKAATSYRRKSKNVDAKTVKLLEQSSMLEHMVKRQNTPQIKLIGKMHSNMNLLPTLTKKTSRYSNKTKKRNLNHSKSMIPSQQRYEEKDYSNDEANIQEIGMIRDRQNSKNRYEVDSDDNYKSKSSLRKGSINPGSTYGGRGDGKDYTIPSIKPSNEEYTEVVKTFQRARLDSLLGLSHNFFNQIDPGSTKHKHNSTAAQAAAVISDKYGEGNAKYQIFDLGNKQFKDCTLQDILNFNTILKRNQKRPSLLFDTESAQNLFGQLHLNRYPSAVQANFSHYMVLLSNINEQILTSIIKQYNLNPILLWEIILKQQYDKVFKIDDNTVFYNIEIIEENQLQKKFVVKIVHLLNRHMMLVITNQNGHQPMLDLMSKIFKFQSLDEYFAQLVQKAQHQAKRDTIKINVNNNSNQNSNQKSQLSHTEPTQPATNDKANGPLLDFNSASKHNSLIQKDNNQHFNFQKVNQPGGGGFSEQCIASQNSNNKKDNQIQVQTVQEKQRNDQQNHQQDDKYYMDSKMSSHRFTSKDTLGSKKSHRDTYAKEISIGRLENFKGPELQQQQQQQQEQSRKKQKDQIQPFNDIDQDEYNTSRQLTEREEKDRLLNQNNDDDISMKMPIDMQEIKLQIKNKKDDKNQKDTNKFERLKTFENNTKVNTNNKNNQVGILSKKIHNSHSVDFQNQKPGILTPGNNKYKDKSDNENNNISGNEDIIQQNPSIVKHVRINTNRNIEMEPPVLKHQRGSSNQQQQPNVDSEAYTHTSQTSSSQEGSQDSDQSGTEGGEDEQSSYDDEEEEEDDDDVSHFVSGNKQFRKSKKQLGPNRFNNHGEQGKLLCEDILYGIFDEGMRKIEPIIVRFEREAQALNNLSLNLSHNEKLGYVRRSHMAKDVMMNFEKDLDIKDKFFKSLMKKEFTSTKMKLLLKFLRGRLNNSKIIMDRASSMVALSDQTYENIVDFGLNEHTDNLNNVMKGLAAITVVVLPYNVVGGFMGMNVLVPFQEEDGLIPFFVLLGVSTILAIILLIGLRKINWM